MRIALLAVQHESNPRSPFRTTLEDFQRGCLVYGPDVVEFWRTTTHEIAGIVYAAEELKAELRPLMAAWAVPGGTLDRSAFDFLLKEATAQVANHASDCDVLVVVLHGAMYADGTPDADGVLLQRVRHIWGDKPIVATVDYHANVTPLMAENCSVLVAYQTNPHLDQFDVGRRAVHHAVTLAQNPHERFCTVVQHPPCLISIVCQHTAQAPWPELFERLRTKARQAAAVQANLCAGFPYADLPEAGPSVTVSGPARLRGDLEACAKAVGDEVFARRHELYRVLMPPEELPEAIFERPERPVVVVDFGDNVGGGAPGDGTLLLHVLARAGVKGVVACLWDPEFVATYRTRVGERLTGRIGGKWCPELGRPLECVAVAERFHEGSWVDPATRHGGLRHYSQGPTLVVAPLRVRVQQTEASSGEWCDVADWKLVVHSLRMPPFSLGQLESVGIDPREAGVIIVKAAVAYRAAYEPIAARILEVETPGPTANDVRLLPPTAPGTGAIYVSLRRPIYPLDPL